MATENTEVVIGLLIQLIAVRRDRSTPEASREYFLERGYPSLAIDAALIQVYSAGELNLHIPPSAPPLQEDDISKQPDTASPLGSPSINPVSAESFVDLNVPDVSDIPDEPEPDEQPSTKNPQDLKLIINASASIIEEAVANQTTVIEHPSQIRVTTSTNTTSFLAQPTDESNHSTLHLVFRLRTLTDQLQKSQENDSDSDLSSDSDTDSDSDADLSDVDSDSDVDPKEMAIKKLSLRCK